MAGQQHQQVEGVVVQQQHQPPLQTPIYLSYREDRLTGRRTNNNTTTTTTRPNPTTTSGITMSRRSSTIPRHSIQFFLIDSQGQDTLAAIGEDQGDAHYNYYNIEGFPDLFAHNKDQVKDWLSAIMTESQEAAGYHLGIVHDVVPNTASDVRLPKFVGMQQEKTTMNNGRHVVNYYLVDECAGEHLAVTGEEKDTKDGHYLYRTVGVFDLIAPLDAHNQADVQSWIDMMTHEGPPHPGSGTGIDDGIAAGGGGGDQQHHQQKKKDAAADDDGTIHHHTRHQSTKTHQRPGGSGTTTATPHSAPSMPYSQHQQYHPYQRRGAGRATASGGGAKVGGRPAGTAGGGIYHQPHYPGTGGGHSDLFRQATTNLQRKAAAGGGGGWKGGQIPDQEVRDVVSSELRKWAGEEAYLRDVLAHQALAFVNDSGLSDEDGGSADRCLGVLKKASKAGGGSGRAAGAAGQETQRAIISALRELIHMPASLPLISLPEMKETVNTLTKHSNEHIAGLATDLLTMWFTATVTQLSVLTQPMYTQDAKSTFERTVVGDKSVLDPVVSQIAHRAIHPPPPPPLIDSSLPNCSPPSKGGGGGTWRGGITNTAAAAAGGVTWSPAISYGGVNNSPSAFATPASSMMMGIASTDGGAGTGGVMMMEEEPSGSLMNVDEGFMMLGPGEHHYHGGEEGGGNNGDDVDVAEDVGIEGAQVLRHPLPADIADNL